MITVTPYRIPSDLLHHPGVRAFALTLDKSVRKKTLTLNLLAWAVVQALITARATGATRQITELGNVERFRTVRRGHAGEAPLLLIEAVALLSYRAEGVRAFGYEFKTVHPGA